MRLRRLAPVVLCCVCPSLACGETLDQAAEHEHALIDHEYDRKEQLVDRGVEHAHQLIDHGHEHHLELIDHLFEAELQLFSGIATQVLTAAPPPGFGPSTCSFSSSPSGAEVFARDFRGQWQYLGRTPLEIERPLLRAEPIEVRAEGHATGRGYLLSDEVRGPCEEHFELEPVFSI